MNESGIDVAAATKNLLTLYSDMNTEEKVGFYNSWAEDYEKLQKLGFKNFHGMDGSEKMLKISESKGLYQKLTHCLVTGEKQLPIQEGTYDLVMIVGGLARQHLPWDILPEMLRVTKTGGLICFTLRAEESDHRSKLLASVQELLKKGLWEEVVERYVEKWQKDMLPTGLAEEYTDGTVAVYRKK
ncbi:methyltransferase-like protein 27 isoform X4 [Pristis pectinata]|nr:methyltransferase-like protein 27 isoform X4 [Pristis pectinata]